MNDVKAEMQFLLDKWRGQKPKDTELAYKEWFDDKEKYFSLKTEFQIRQAEEIFGVKRQTVTLGDRETMKEIGDATLVWKVDKDHKVEVLVKRK